MRIGIDVGGTFTDIVLIDDVRGRIRYTKGLTTHGDLAKGVISGIDKILGMAVISFDHVDYLVHGTTIGTNALIERKGARTGLITTEGMRDILEIGRIERPAAGLYDIFVDTPLPLVPRYLRLEVRERVGADGEVVVPLDEGTARQAVESLKDQAVESIAICFLFGFRNPAHEERVGEICAEMFPEAAVSVSSDPPVGPAASVAAPWASSAPSPASARSEAAAGSEPESESSHTGGRSRSDIDGRRRRPASCARRRPWGAWRGAFAKSSPKRLNNSRACCRSIGSASSRSSCSSAW